ncbi:MAG: hypothetical protein Q9M24_09150 [Mariprofundaceae bacterium]|nr:hypothetical protein [Mariprofundaceae bacterium]
MTGLKNVFMPKKNMADHDILWTDVARDDLDDIANYIIEYVLTPFSKDIET